MAGLAVRGRSRPGSRKVAAGVAKAAIDPDLPGRALEAGATAKFLAVGLYSPPGRRRLCSARSGLGSHPAGRHGGAGQRGLETAHGPGEKRATGTGVGYASAGSSGGLCGTGLGPAPAALFVYPSANLLAREMAIHRGGQSSLPPWQAFPYVSTCWNRRNGWRWWTV